MESIRTRNIMYTNIIPYIQNKSTTPEDLMPLPIDDLHKNDHKPQTSINTEQVEWYEKNKAMFEQMMLPNEQK